MHINDQTQKQLNNFEAFIKLMADMGMVYDDYGSDTETVKLAEIRDSIIEKKYSGIGHAEAYFKHPEADVWVHIECETPLYKFDQSKVRILVSEGRCYYGSRENPYKPLGKTSTLKARIDDYVHLITERETSASRKDKFFTLNKPAAEKMIQQLTGTTPVVSEDRHGYQKVSISYRGAKVDVGLSSLIKEGTVLEVSVSIGFNAAKSTTRVTLQKWVSLVDQLHDLGLLG